MFSAGEHYIIVISQPFAKSSHTKVCERASKDSAAKKSSISILVTLRKGGRDEFISNCKKFQAENWFSVRTVKNHGSTRRCAGWSNLGMSCRRRMQLMSEEAH